LCNVDPNLLAIVVTRLEELNVRRIFLTKEQVTAVREAAARSFCRVTEIIGIPTGCERE